MTIILAILVFGVVVLVHEWGHFIVAKKCGILVEEFAMGMGPILFKKQGMETLYTIRAFPIGGFCRMLGEDNGNDDPRAFGNKKIWQRFLVIVAGAVMNFILAFIVIFAQVNFGVINTLEIGSVAPDYPAYTAGLLPGDKITHFNGKKMTLFQKFSFAIAENGSENTVITVIRNGEKLDFNISPIQIDNSYKVGVSPVIKNGLFVNDEELKNELLSANIFELLSYSANVTGFYIELIFESLLQLFTGGLSVSDMAGPIGFVQVLDDTNQQALDNIETIGKTNFEIIKDKITTSLEIVASFIVMLSVNLGVFNLIPLPALDGGRLVFIIFEAIMRKPVDPEKEGMVHFVGFVLLMGLAIFVATVDIGRIINPIVNCNIVKLINYM